MANLQNRNSNDPNHVNTNGNVDPDRAVSYRDGYVHGRVTEQSLQEDGLEVRDNNNAARGLLVGITLTSLVGLALAAMFFWYPRSEPTPAPAVVPAPVSSPAASQSQTKQTTVIEKHTVEQVPVSVPQQSAPAPRTDVNVNVPNPSQQPANTKSSTTVNVNPAQPPNSSSESSTSTSKSNSDKSSSSTSNDKSSSQNKSGSSSGNN